MAGMISPSMMCAGVCDVQKYLTAFERHGVEYLHIDIMDGSFVPNFTLGTDYVKNLRKHTSIPMDIHLMIDRPEGKIDWFELAPGDFVSVHYEATPHLQRTLANIRAAGARPMVAINPATPIEVLEYVVDDVDGILVMTVNPGFAGQKLIPQTLGKIRRVRQWLDDIGRQDVLIEADGNVSFPNAKLMREAGADIFVAGTSSIFTDKIPLDEAIQQFREVIA